VQDPLVHHGRHFGRVAHAFCNIQTLLANGITLMNELEERGQEAFTHQYVPQLHVCQELADGALAERGRSTRCFANY
jgi:hypothetical protein